MRCVIARDTVVSHKVAQALVPIIGYIIAYTILSVFINLVCVIITKRKMLN